MSANEFQNWLRFVLEEGTEGTEADIESLEVRTFEEAGIMTRNQGLVVTVTVDGSEFQLTIVRSR